MSISNRPDIVSLDTISPKDLARQPGGVLMLLQEELKAQQETLKKRNAVLFAALEERYAESARDKLQYQGKESGVVHVNDGDLVVDVEAKKSVVWDQSILDNIWFDIQSAGDDPRVYMKRELKVSETALKAWPKNIQDAFMPARTVKSGKPTYTIRETRTTEGGK